MPKDGNLQELDARRFRANIISKLPPYVTHIRGGETNGEPFSSHRGACVRRRFVEGNPRQAFVSLFRPGGVHLPRVVPNRAVRETILMIFSLSISFFFLFFKLAETVGRCKMPNVHQSTGERHPAEPDRSLREHRSVDEGAPGSGCLGMQLTPLFANTERPEDLATVLEVGMSIDVLERGAHRYIRI